MNAVDIEPATSDLALQVEFPAASLAAFDSKDTTLKRLKNDAGRLEKLFELYARMGARA